MLQYLKMYCPRITVAVLYSLCNTFVKHCMATACVIELQECCTTSKCMSQDYCCSAALTLYYYSKAFHFFCFCNCTPAMTQPQNAGSMMQCCCKALHCHWLGSLHYSNAAVPLNELLWDHCLSASMTKFYFCKVLHYHCFCNCTTAVPQCLNMHCNRITVGRELEKMPFIQLRFFSMTNWVTKLKI